MNNNNSNITPLHYACRYGHLKIAQYLIRDAHCNPSYENKYGETPLHYACRYGHLKIAQYLIRDAHCNPSCKNKNGDTPLHYACRYGHTHTVQYLLSTGKVDPLAKNKNGMTPMYYASRHDNSYDLLKLFQSFPQCKRDFPVHTYTKLVLTGYSGAGKTPYLILCSLLLSPLVSFSPLALVMT